MLKFWIKLVTVKLGAGLDWSAACIKGISVQQQEQEGQTREPLKSPFSFFSFPKKFPAQFYHFPSSDPSRELSFVSWHLKWNSRPQLNGGCCKFVPYRMVAYYNYAVWWPTIPYGGAQYRMVAYHSLLWHTIPYGDVLYMQRGNVPHLSTRLQISYHTLLLKQSTNAKTPKRSKNHKNTLKSQKTAWAQNRIKFIISVLVGTLDMFHTLPYYSLHYTLKKYSQLNRGRCNNVHRRVLEREICITLFKRERYNNFHEITLSLQE